MTGPWGPLVLAVALRPRLWRTTLRQLRRVGPRGWWRRWPPSPRPPDSYVAFRLQTMYGTSSQSLSPSDLVGYLEWCRRMHSDAG